MEYFQQFTSSGCHFTCDGFSQLFGNFSIRFLYKTGKTSYSMRRQKIWRFSKNKCFSIMSREQILKPSWFRIYPLLVQEVAGTKSHKVAQFFWKFSVLKVAGIPCKISTQKLRGLISRILYARLYDSFYFVQIFAEVKISRVVNLRGFNITQNFTTKSRFIWYE